jgi:tRNA A-37 threonylcarbamoyl transferase component Bud32
MTPLAITIGPMRWTVHPEWRDRLLGPQGLRLDEWLRTGQAEVVKHGPHRTVYRIALPSTTGASQVVYLKHNRPWNLRAWLRELIRPPKSRIEYDQAREIAARGIDTVEPLAVGEPLGLVPAESFLITRGLCDVQPLNTYLEETLPTLEPVRQVRLRFMLARTLADFLRRLHDQGVTHLDLHPGNLLLRLEADDQPRFFLVDLHATTLGPPLGEQACLDNLAQLNNWFALKASRSDRLRFWQHYRGTTDPQVAAELERRTLRSQFHLWNTRFRRCLGNNRYYQRLRRGELTGHAVRDLAPDLLQRLAGDPDAPFRQAGVSLLKDSASSTVAVLHEGGRRFLYKRFRVRSWGDPWLALLRQTPALRSWILGHALLERGLPTARPLLLLQRQRYSLLTESYLLTEMIEPATNLHYYLWGLDKLPADQRQRQRRRLIDRLARLLRALHCRGLAHRDLKANNILVRDQEFGVRGQESGIWLIDLVGASRHGEVGRRRKVRNLARLNASLQEHHQVSHGERLRFLLLYLQAGLKGRAGWKRWWRQIEQATQAKQERNRRRDRILG